jgi:hypothetical protein
MKKLSVKAIEERNVLFGLLRSKYGSLVKRDQIYDVVSDNSLPTPWWIFKEPQFKSSERGYYVIPSGNLDMVELGEKVATTKAKKVKPVKVTKKLPKDKVPSKKLEKKSQVQDTSDNDVDFNLIKHFSGSEDKCNLVPLKDDLFVPFGNFSELKSIFSSKIFMPVYITGLSGNGKTLMVEQAAAQSKRDLIRLNITIETDEDDLFGGFRLINGETVWFDGPVIRAMKSGSILLLDEVDLMSTKCLCLQPVLEGKGVLLKKVNRYVKANPGFTIVATANTKGKGSDDGRFVGTNVINEAFLERFGICFEQEYPSSVIEKKILAKVFKFHGVDDSEFIDVLTAWADVVRQSFINGVVDEIISTRRLVHIANSFAIFKDKKKSVMYCINRFDLNTKEAFMELFDKLSPTANSQEPGQGSTDALTPEVVDDLKALNVCTF